MIVNKGILLRRLLKRMPTVRFYDMMYLVNCASELMIKRIIEDRPIIIDGFGTLHRVQEKPRRAFNVATRQMYTFEVNAVRFRPHIAFLRMIECVGKEYIKELIRKKSREAIKKRVKKKRLV